MRAGEGYTPGNGEPRQVPIIQSTTFKYNTRVKIWENYLIWRHPDISTPVCRIRLTTTCGKIAAMEGGTAAMLTSSGQAANFFAMFNICEAGDHIVASIFDLWVEPSI